MGDRSIIRITSRHWEAPITLYGHFAGDLNITAVKNVMEYTARVGDPSYLTAQLFAEFSTLGHYTGEGGFGIGQGEIWETENPPVVIDGDRGAVFVGCVGNDDEPCAELVPIDTWEAELGKCLECSNKYFGNE